MVNNLKNKESYLYRRTEQLRQWERVIDNLTLMADKASGKRKTELLHHIIKIRVKKARTEVILRQLREAEDCKWDELKTILEISWRELRQSFLKASAKSK
jgi:hypothetical protein